MSLTLDARVDGHTYSYGNKYQQKKDDEGNKGQDDAPDGARVAVARELLDGDDGHQRDDKYVVDHFGLHAETQQRGNDLKDDDHVSNVDHRHEAL